MSRFFSMFYSSFVVSVFTLELIFCKKEVEFHSFAGDYPIFPTPFIEACPVQGEIVAPSPVMVVSSGCWAPQHGQLCGP